MTNFAIAHLTGIVLVLGLMPSTVLGQEQPPAAAPPRATAPIVRTGNYTRQLQVGGQRRTYLIYVPKNYDPQKATPVVLALHGVAMNGPMMVLFSGLNKKADEAGFIVVYPSGTGVGPLLRWNAGGLRGNPAESKVDDVAFIRQLLDELPEQVNVDRRRIYATGLSNGGMMCYRLAAELSDRIAAIAPVAATMAIDECKPGRPVSLIHFHGLKDTIVPFQRGASKRPSMVRLKGVEESIQIWVKLNECDQEPLSDTLSKPDDEMQVTRRCYSGGTDGAEVILITIDEGGHTWPGQPPPVGFIGKSTSNISANDLMWEFFEQHPLKRP